MPGISDGSQKLPTPIQRAAADWKRVIFMAMMTEAINIGISII